MPRLSVTWTLVLVMVAAVAQAVPLPFGGTDLRLWLRADAGLTLDTVSYPDRVIGWADQTGIGGNVTAEDGVGPGGARPLWVDNAINGQPALWFDTTARRIDGPAVLPGGDGARTIFVVGNSATAGNRNLFDPNGQGSGATVFRVTPEVAVRFGNGNRMFEGSPVDATFAIVAAQLPAGGTIGDTLMYMNSAAPLAQTSSSSPGNSVATGTSGYRLGASSYTGYIAEVLVFEAQLSQAEIDKVGSYLAGKYGIAASFAGDEIFWDNGSTDVVSPVSPPYPGDNLWSTPSNWRADNNAQNVFPNDTLPGPTDRVNISLHDVAADPPAPCNVEAGDDLLVNSVRVGGNFGLGVGGHGVLNVNGGSLTIADNGGVGTGGRLELGGTGNRNGVLNMTGGTLNVGLDIITGAGIGTGASTINLDGGTLATPSTDITVDFFNINPDSTPDTPSVTYTRSGGTLTVNNTLTLGGEQDTGSNYRGNLTQTGGAVIVNGDLVFGGAAGTEGGTYNFRGGSLTVGGDIVETAANVDSAQFHLDADIDGGAAVFTVGGSITTQRFALAQAGNSTGTFTLAAGKSLTTSGTLAVGSGANSTGRLTVDGGILDTSNVYIGESGGANGEAIVTGGSWTVAQFLRVGHSGTGMLRLEDGTLDVTGTSGSPRGLRLGENASGVGEVILGKADGSTSPTLTNSGANIEVGLNGTGTFTQHSGTVSVLTNNLVIAQGTTSNGTYAMHDGTLTIHPTGDLNFNSGQGVFNQSGGIVNVGRDLQLGTQDLATSTSTYTLDGGALNVGRHIFIGKLAHGELNYVDGTLTFGGTLYMGGDGNGAAANRPNAVGTLNIGSATTAPTLTTKQFEIGRHNVGVMNHINGTVNVATSNLVIGQYANSQGTYNLTDPDGLLIVANQFNFNQGTGIFNQSGGTVTANGGITMAANASNGYAEYNLSNGKLEVFNTNFELGRDNQAVFTQTGGAVEMALTGPAANVVLGQNANGDGTYILQDGSLTLGQDLNVANRGKGTFVQEGGAVDAARYVQIGNTENQANTDGLYEMKGGSLTTGDQLRVGQRNKGVFHQTGGTVTVGTGLVLGNVGDATTDGTYILDGGTLNITNNLAIGHRGTGQFDFIDSDVPLTMNATRWIYVGGEGSTSATAAPNANGTFNIGDGVSSPVLNARQFEVGRHGVGVVNQKSGTVTVHGDHNLVVSQYANGDGTYNMMDGVLQFGTGSNGNINYNYGTGVFTQTGGLVDLNGNDINIARYNTSHSTYTLGGGVLDLGGGSVVFHLNQPNGIGIFNFTGGTLLNVGTFGDTLTQDGGTLAPGAPAGTMAVSGNYALNAGVLNSELASAGAFDVVDASGTVTLGGGAETPVIDVDLLGGYVPTMGEYFDIAVADGGITNADLTGVGFDFSDAQTGYHWWREIVSLGGSAEALRLTVSPEPATLSMLALGALGIAIRRRRRG